MRFHPFARGNRIVECRPGRFRRRRLLTNRTNEVIGQIGKGVHCRNAHARVAVPVNRDCRDGFEKTRTALLRHPRAQHGERGNDGVNVGRAESRERDLHGVRILEAVERADRQRARRRAVRGLDEPGESRKRACAKDAQARDRRVTSNRVR